MGEHTVVPGLRPLIVRGTKFAIWSDVKAGFSY